MSGRQREVTLLDFVSYCQKHVFFVMIVFHEKKIALSNSGCIDS